MRTLPAITITDERYAGLQAAASANKAASPEAYHQTLVDGACDSYRKQFDTATVEGLSNKLAAEVSKREAAEAEVERLKAEQDKG